ncbi:non-specific lipid-transfer protein 1-like [Herrania umbratica]|uniref:Non-specific lipid-transfer protein n=1 Tax=Herrania umbratica TaxID=108875 RepID=A0A6J1BDD6_9ROSI|nr:non-specific lipid-transfer protein 1-like [Herrania umbratica]
MSRSPFTCKLMCTLFVLTGLMTESARVVHALTCPEVSKGLVPCVTYLSTRSSFGHCCTQIRLLNSKAKTTSDRQGVCRCLTSLAAQFRIRHRLDFNLVKQLPGKCNVNIRYSITTENPNCSQVK